MSNSKSIDKTSIPLPLWKGTEEGTNNEQRPEGHVVRLKELVRTVNELVRFDPSTVVDAKEAYCRGCKA